MERITSLENAQKIMGKNFIGLTELKSVEKLMGIYIPRKILESPPIIQFDKKLLIEKKDDFILFLSIPFYKDKTPLTIVKMREHFGWDPNKNEPCFYNQDWYLKELFATSTTFDINWKLIKKNVYDEYRGKSVNEISKSLDIRLPEAVLITYLFFAWYLIRNETLWINDYLWCNDLDLNGDQIYVGKYIKPNGNNKNGFEIHRHLKIKHNYSFVDCR